MMEKIISVDGFEEEGVLWVVEGDIGVVIERGGLDIIVGLDEEMEMGMYGLWVYGESGEMEVGDVESVGEWSVKEKGVSFDEGMKKVEGMMMDEDVGEEFVEMGMFVDVVMKKGGVLDWYERGVFFDQIFSVRNNFFLWGVDFEGDTPSPLKSGLKSFSVTMREN